MKLTEPDDGHLFSKKIGLTYSVTENGVLKTFVYMCAVQDHSQCVFTKPTFFNFERDTVKVVENT